MGLWLGLWVGPWAGSSLGLCVGFEWDKINAMGEGGAAPHMELQIVFGSGLGRWWSCLHDRPGERRPVERPLRLPLVPPPLVHAVSTSQPPTPRPAPTHQLTHPLPAVRNRLERKSMNNVLMRLRQACNHPVSVGGWPKDCFFSQGVFGWAAPRVAAGLLA